MTKEEAIHVINQVRDIITKSPSWMEEATRVVNEAAEIAIKALEAQEWIPCSERLPDNDDFVIVTILDERGDTPYRYSDFGWYFDRAKCWIIDAEERTDVIAWMPLPTPYIVG